MQTTPHKSPPAGRRPAESGQYPRLASLTIPGSFALLGSFLGEVMFADRNRFLALLAEGWCLPFVVEPLMGSHGLYAICLEKRDD